MVPGQPETVTCLRLGDVTTSSSENHHLSLFWPLLTWVGLHGCYFFVICLPIQHDLNYLLPPPPCHRALSCGGPFGREPFGQELGPADGALAAVPPVAGGGGGGGGDGGSGTRLTSSWFSRSSMRRSARRNSAWLACLASWASWACLAAWASLAALATLAAARSAASQAALCQRIKG